MKKKDHRNKTTHKPNHTHHNNKSVVRKRPRHVTVIKKKKYDIEDTGIIIFLD